MSREGSTRTALQFLFFEPYQAWLADERTLEVPERPTLVVADCWLVGRPVEAPPPKTGFLRRILGQA
ncbi:hypothetical protein [Sorangium sp. So ce1099]|uniref:hypothetical protein n=1 Tax=Sorangium sp. So ce1099 TaxID=3133331 RepID=UPI003F5E84EA